MDKIMDKNIFNTPLEIGIRLLYVFKNTTKNSMDLQRIIYYNYLLVHSADISKEQESLHPDLPNRSCEVLIGRRIVMQGLNLLISKGLIDVKYSKTGIKYTSNKYTSALLENFSTGYSRKLNEMAVWVCKNLDEMNDTKLDKFMKDNLGKWGSEFSREFHLVGEM